jgi:phosphoribosylformylglycinamidine cyclo-ligase
VEIQGNKLSYETLVGYSRLDPFKKRCQEAASQTSKNAERFGVQGVERSRGESAYVMQLPDGTWLGHVEEGLGTKNLIADEVRKFAKKSFYDQIAQDTAAMILNDLATVGIPAVSLAMHVAAGDSSWFTDEERTADLVRGWKRSCDLAGCIWSGGETPTLRDMVASNTVVLAGSAVGLSRRPTIIDPVRIKSGDRIMGLKSSGVCANGLTKVREIAEHLPRGYESVMSNNRTFGEALLDPTFIYSRFVEKCLKANMNIHYAIHVTGHGWRKFMRAPQPFRYVLDLPVPRPLVFDFIQEHGNIDDREMFKTFNMGIGFALIVPESDENAVFQLGRQEKIDVGPIGRVLPAKGQESCVEIEWADIVFKGSELDIR